MPTCLMHILWRLRQVGIQTLHNSIIEIESLLCRLSFSVPAVEGSAGSLFEHKSKKRDLRAQLLFFLMVARGRQE